MLYIQSPVCVFVELRVLTYDISPSPSSLPVAATIFHRPVTCIGSG